MAQIAGLLNMHFIFEPISLFAYAHIIFFSFFGLLIELFYT